MSKTLKIRLRPIEPYFLGTDRTFKYKKCGFDKERKDEYYIRSEEIPSQTTLFGVLRYLGIKQKDRGYRLTEEDKKNIGEESFSIGSQSQSFGRINSISPVYIEDVEKNELYIPTPFDHKTKDDTEKYNPMEMDKERVVTSRGTSIFPGKDDQGKGEYDSKNGITDSFLSIDSGIILSRKDVFQSYEKTGIGISKGKSYQTKYYKMVYIKMKKTFSFVFYATVDDEFVHADDSVVFMGKWKSTFAVEIEETGKDDIEHKLSEVLQPEDGLIKVYVYSDSRLNNDDFLKESLFSITDVRTARGFRTNYETTDQRKRFKKTEELYRLIRAGSILYFEPDKREDIESCFKNPHLETAGLNRILILEPKN